MIVNGEGFLSPLVTTPDFPPTFSPKLLPFLDESQERVHASFWK
jgi:hypothetical protein